MADHLRRSWSQMRPWLGARQLPAARMGSALAGGPVSWPGPSRSKGNMSRKEPAMAIEVLSPHAAGNHRALVSEETDDRMLTRLARAAHGGTDPGPGQLVRSTGKRTGCGYAAAIGFLISRPSTPRNPMVPVTRAALRQLRTRTADMGDVRGACTLKSSSTESAI
jgi:hypothetical protein